MKILAAAVESPHVVAEFKQTVLMAFFDESGARTEEVQRNGTCNC